MVSLAPVAHVVFPLATAAMFGYWWLFYRRRDVRGVGWLSVIGVFAGTGSLVYYLALHAQSTSGSYALLGLYYLLTGLASVALFVFGLVWTDRERYVTVRVVAAVGAPVVAVPLANVAAVALSSEALFELVWATRALQPLGSLTVPVRDRGPLMVLRNAYGTVLVALTIGLLGAFTTRPEQRLYRRQNALLLVGLLGAVAIGTAANLTGLSLAVVPVGLLFAATAFAVGIFGAGFFDVVPLATEDVFEEIEGAVLVYGTDGTVVDSNQRARVVLGGGGTLTGRAVTAVLREAGVPPVVDAGALEDVTALDDVLDDCEFTLVRGGEQRHYAASVSTLTAPSGGPVGRGLLLYEVTDQRRRQQELALLKQVLGRILRHNLRNDLSVIRLNAEYLGELTDGEPADVADTIVDTVRTLEDVGEKAQLIEQLTERGVDREPVDVAAAVDRAVAEVRDSYPDAVVETDRPRTAPAFGVPEVEVAVRNVVENACEHAEDAAPRVEVEVARRGGQVVTTVTDDGPGIPEEEVAVLERREETDLQHGSGAGLWLVDWIVKRSGGELTLTDTGDGTRATIALDAATSPGIDGTASPAAADGGDQPDAD
jgi:signal transduction histidine kinase